MLEIVWIRLNLLFNEFPKIWRICLLTLLKVKPKLVSEPPWVSCWPLKWKLPKQKKSLWFISKISKTPFPHAKTIATATFMLIFQPLFFTQTGYSLLLLTWLRHTEKQNSGHSKDMCSKESKYVDPVCKDFWLLKLAVYWMVNGNLANPAAVQGAQTVQTKVVLRSVTHLQGILWWSVGLMYTIIVRSSKAVRAWSHSVSLRAWNKLLKLRKKEKLVTLCLQETKAGESKRKEGLGRTAPPPKKGP